jgi:hypothetical protein
VDEVSVLLGYEVWRPLRSRNVRNQTHGDVATYPKTRDNSNNSYSSVHSFIYEYLHHYPQPFCYLLTRHSPQNTDSNLESDKSFYSIPLNICFYVKTFTLAMRSFVSWLRQTDRISSWTAAKKRMCSLRKSWEPRRKSINTGALVDDHK